MIPKIITGETINELNVKAFDLILNSGKNSVNRNSSTMGDIYVEYDVNAVLLNPRNRHLCLEGRNSNIFAMIGESIWVIAGRSDISYLSNFLKRAKDFSDDGKTWRAAYGDRIYECNQLQNVLDTFKKDGLYTRRATLSIYDPHKDTSSSLKKYYGLDNTVDIPCFAGHTNVLTMSGYKKIKDIEVDELVLSYNKKTESMEPKKVVWSGKTKTVDIHYRLTLKSGETIDVTDEHIVYIKRYTNNGQSRQPYTVEEVKVKDLKENDYILSTPIHISENNLSYKKSLRENEDRSRHMNKIVNIEIINESIPVYDLTIEDNHNFVIDGGWIVHNCNQWLNFYVDNEDFLNMKVIQRSSDAIWGGMSINLTEFSMLHEIVYNCIVSSHPELKLGSYNHSISNFHIYEKTSKQARDVLEKREIQNLDSSNDIRMVTPDDITVNKMLFNIIAKKIEKKNKSLASIDRIFEDFNIPLEDNILYLYSYFCKLYLLSKENSYSSSNRNKIVHNNVVREFIEKQESSNNKNDFYLAIKNSKFRNFEL